MGNNLMNTVLISVIIPVYKVEQYLEKCIESVCSQTYENLEIILVDDGSPDSCPQICDKWERKDSRIRVIHKKNGGLSDARNAGLKVASGEWAGESRVMAATRFSMTNSAAASSSSWISSSSGDSTRNMAWFSMAGVQSME